jgi:NADH-quinone oxidoreductase subunit N
MTVGNLVALRQTRMVRLLAWSSVAQAGYILAPLAMGSPGVPAAIAYAVFFVLLEFTAFAVVVAVRGHAPDGGTLTDYRGAARRNPWLGAALVLAFAGLAGLPPGLAGLFAKVTIVAALINGGWGWLAAVVAVNAVIALAYYIRATALLYTQPQTPGIPLVAPVAEPSTPEAGSTPSEAEPAAPSPATTITAVLDPNLLEAATHPEVQVPRPVAAAIAAAATITILLGFTPQWIFDALLG